MPEVYSAQEGTADPAQAPAQEAEPQADTMCRSGMHYQYSPESDSFESAGPCDQHPEHTTAENDMSNQAAGPLDTANPAYRDYNGPQAGQGQQVDPAELERTIGLLKSAVQGPAPKKPVRMGVPGAAASVQKGAGF